MELDKLMYQAGIVLVIFAAWEQLQDALPLIHNYPPVDNLFDAAQPFTVYGLFDLMQAPTATDAGVLAYLAQLTGWD